MSNSNFTENPAKFLSIFVERMVPDYVREDHPMFVTFMRKYFEYLERETSINGELGEYKQITDLIENVDIDHTLDQFIPEFEKQYLTNIPEKAIGAGVITTEKSFLAKNIKQSYKEKGTVNALDFLFRREFNTEATISYPKDFMLKASGSVWYEPQWVEVSESQEEVQKLYNKKVVGQISGATAFVDIVEGSTMPEHERLLLTQVSGSFIQYEEIWEDVGTSGNTPNKLTVSSEGIIAPSTCYINGVAWSTEYGANVPQTRSACEGLVEEANVKTAVWLPNGYWVDSAGFLSSDRKMQDNDYYQDFSYVIKSDVPIQSYREVLKKLVHPVGLKLFAEYVFESTVPMGTRLPEKYAAYLIYIFSYLDIAVDIFPIGRCDNPVYSDEMTCIDNGSAWSRGKSFKTAHTRHYTWTRPLTFELQEGITIPWSHMRFDGTTRENVVNGVPQGSGVDELIVGGVCSYTAFAQWNVIEEGSTSKVDCINLVQQDALWGVCSDVDVADEAECIANGESWENINYCSDGTYAEKSTCEASGAVWTYADYQWEGTVIETTLSSNFERVRQKVWRCTEPGTYNYNTETERLAAAMACYAAGGDWNHKIIGLNHSDKTDAWIFVNEQWKGETLYSKSEDFIGEEHSGFEKFLESGYDDYVVEILKQVEAASANVDPSTWGSDVMNESLEDQSWRDPADTVIAAQCSDATRLDETVCLSFGACVGADGLDMGSHGDDYSACTNAGFYFVRDNTWTKEHNRDLPNIKSQHVDVNIVTPPNVIGTTLKEKLYQIFILDDDIKLALAAFPEEVVLAYYQQLKVLDISEQPPLENTLNIRRTFKGIKEYQLTPASCSDSSFSNYTTCAAAGACSDSTYDGDENGCVNVGSCSSSSPGLFTRSLCQASGFTWTPQTPANVWSSAGNFWIDESVSWTGIYDDEFMATDGRMVGCEVWELLVAKGLESILEYNLRIVQVESYAPQQNYRFWEQNRENTIIQSIYGSTNDIIDSVHIEAFDIDGGIRTHTHGGTDGFAPMMDAVLTKGLELPEMGVGASAFHTHDFDGTAIQNLIVHGKEMDASGISYQQARDLINREAYEVPVFHGANLVCGGIMTPPLWGDWVDSQQDPRYNGSGECFNSQYTDMASCIASYAGNPMFWMPPMCSNMSNMSQTVCESMGDTWAAGTAGSCSNAVIPDDQTCNASGAVWTYGIPDMCMSSEASCNAAGHSWGYFTLADLPPMKGHVSYFVKGEVVDRQRGRTADPLTMEQARQLIDGDVASVTLYDNLGALDKEGKVTYDDFEITIGGTITNILGEITSGHYHEYDVTYDADWETKQDWRGNDMTHGFVYTPVMTWLCFNYKPDLGVDPTAMGGMDFMGNPWPQNVFMEVPDSYVGGFLNNPDITLHHNQVWSEELNPNVDWVEIYSSNFIQDVPGSGDIDDLIGVESIGVGTDIVVIEAYPKLNGDWITLVDQSGYIYLRNTTTLVQTTLLDLSTLQHVIGLGSFANYDERGALGMCYHPNYATNGKFYVYYMTEQGGGGGAWGFPLSSTIISEFTAVLTGNYDVANVSSERILMTIPQPDFNHNGGELCFGPDDGYLYIGLGDGGSAGDTSWASGHGGHGEYGNAQNPTNLLGNILRIDVDTTENGLQYGIPSDNPFINSIYKEGQAAAEPFRPEIYAYGFRNPWRFSFDVDGNLWCADVGQDKFEEINIIEKGGNYGWRVLEGYHYYEEDQAIIDKIAVDLGYSTTLEYLNDLKKPIHEYSHGTGISILGGFVYRGTLCPELTGKYVFGDWGTNWAGTSGRLYTLEKDDAAGNAMIFNVLPNAANGANHSHKIRLTASEVIFLQANPGVSVVTAQTDTIHAEFYVHTFTIIYSTADNKFHIISQTNPEGHDILEFDDYDVDATYTRKSLSFWDPVTEVVTLTTFNESVLSMGEDSAGEIYFSTRMGINTFQPPSGAGPDNTTIYKITQVYNSVDTPNAPAQIPATQKAHTHGYKVTYDQDTSSFDTIEISDIEMPEWDAFYPVWVENDPASHVHPVITAWSHSIDVQIPLGSSAGWYYNTDTEVWGPYDIGADTAWAPPAIDTGGYISVDVAPNISVNLANEYDKVPHIHYFDDVLLDSFGVNYGRRSNSLSKVAAEILANQEEGSIHTLYSSIHDDGERRHYHEYNITYSVAQRLFVSEEIAEWEEGVRDTGAYLLADIQTHEHPTAVDGILTSVGWNGDPSFAPPVTIIGQANDWDNLNGSLIPHQHYFNETTLDQVGPNSSRTSVYLTNQQTTDLISGSLTEVILYSSIYQDHYHEYSVTFDSLNGTLNIQEVEQWVSTDNQQYFIRTPADHRHPTSVDGVPSGTGYNQIITVDNLPVYNTPGYPYAGGSHPHFFDGTVVGPFADGTVKYAVGLSTDTAYKLIDGILSQATLYDSISGAHFHLYTIKWNDADNIFYCTNSTTYVKGGIEDATQDPLRYYPSVVLGPSEGLHWHNLTIHWNPNDEVIPQQTGGSVYQTNIASTYQTLVNAPTVNINVNTTALNPVSTSYPDTPSAGDTTTIITYSDLTTTTTTTTTVTEVTETIQTNHSDGTSEFVVLPAVVTTDVETAQTTNTIENEFKRKTFVNAILQVNNPPVLTIGSTFIDGEGTHDHLLYQGCSLDTQGPFSGRLCEPISLGQANQLINEQDSTYGIVWYDSANGALSHYHSYSLKFNPLLGVDGTFLTDPISQYDRFPGSGTNVHKFLLTGGYHSHTYFLTTTEYATLVAGGLVSTSQSDATHADIYTHTLVIRLVNFQYQIVSQTSDYDNHDTIVYQGEVAEGGQWIQSTQGAGLGDHIHSVTVDESNIWPIPS